MHASKVQVVEKEEEQVMDAGLALKEKTALDNVVLDTVLNAKEGEFVFFTATVEGKEAVVKIRQSMPKTEEILNRLGEVTLDNTGANKAWAAYKAEFPGPGLAVDLFVPALETSDPEEIQKLLAKQTKKLLRKNFLFVREDAARYESVTRPHLDNIPEASVAWVGNIMKNVKPEGCAEKYDISKEKMNEKVVYSDPDPEQGFAILVDFKWRNHPKTMAELEESPVTNPVGVYCIAFPVKQGLRTIRDLTAENLPMLENLHKHAVRTMQELYNLPASKLRLFFHYHPTFYYLHLHITSMDVDFGIETERAHLLEEVISNLKLSSGYYQQATLVYKVPEDSPLAST